MSITEIAKWKDDVAALPTKRIRLGRPIDVFLGESIDVAKFHARYWATVRNAAGTIVRPGLELAGGGRGTKALLSPETGAEIRSLQAAARAADTEYQFALTRPNRAPTEDAREVLSRVVAALRWLLDDGIEDEADIKLANLDIRHDNPTNNDALASALEAYADLAHQLRGDLDAFPTFDVTSIDRARALAVELRESSGPGPLSDDARRAIELRDGLFTLLRQRVRIVRRAADFVFQEHPEIVRELASAYDRRRRAKNRAATKPESESESESVEPTEA